MKKNKYIFFMLLLIICLNANAQSYSDAFSVNIGVVQDGIGGLFNYNYLIAEHDYIELGVIYNSATPNYFTDEIRVNSEVVALNMGYSKNALVNRDNTMTLNVDWHGIVGNEFITNKEKISINGNLIENEKQFIFGVGLGLEGNLKLLEQFSITLKATKYFYYNSNLSGRLGFVGLGFKYYIL